MGSLLGTVSEVPFKLTPYKPYEVVICFLPIAFDVYNVIRQLREQDLEFIADCDRCRQKPSPIRAQVHLFQ